MSASLAPSKAHTDANPPSSAVSRFADESGPLRHLTIQECSALTGYSRSTIYRALVRGDLVAVKNGNACRIPVTSLRDYIAQLPRAVFGKDALRQGRKKKAA